MSIAKPGGYMGIWQFHQTAEMLGLPVGGVYPDEKTNPIVRKDMNRTMLSRNPTLYMKVPIYIMWSSLTQKSKPHDVKHFVIILRKPRQYIFIMEKDKEPQQCFEVTLNTN